MPYRPEQLSVLHQLVAEVCPIYGLLGDGTVQYKPEATSEQRAAALAAIAAYDPNHEYIKLWGRGAQLEWYTLRSGVVMDQLFQGLLGGTFQAALKVEFPIISEMLKWGNFKKLDQYLQILNTTGALTEDEEAAFKAICVYVYGDNLDWNSEGIPNPI